MAVTVTKISPLGQEISIRAEFLNAAVAGVCNENVAICVHCNTIWKLELAIGASLGSPLKEEGAGPPLPC